MEDVTISQEEIENAAITYGVDGELLQEDIEQALMENEEPVAIPENRGTIKPNPEFDAEKSAIRLHKAMRGIGTDEKQIIDVLVTNDNMQLQAIKEKYKTMYGRDLEEDLKVELGGYFEEAVLAILTSPYDLLVDALENAFKGAGTNEEVLTEVLCSRKNDELQSLTWWYEQKYERPLDEAMQSELSGGFQSLMRGFIATGRDQTETKDSSLARKDAQDLYDAGIGKNMGTDDSEFIRILNTRSFPQLQETFEAYEQIAQETLEDSVKKEFTGELKNGLLWIAKRIKDPIAFFAERLRKSMAGAGTDDKSLIRLLVSRSQIDLADIKERYKEMYGKELAQDIKKETSGDYRKLLLAIIGK